MTTQPTDTAAAEKIAAIQRYHTRMDNPGATWSHERVACELKVAHRDRAYLLTQLAAANERAELATAEAAVLLERVKEADFDVFRWKSTAGAEATAFEEEKERAFKSETAILARVAELEGNQRGWKGIESAPKDGTSVALVIMWDKPFVTAGYFENGCWTYHGEDGPDDDPPTYWLPFPEIPNFPADGKE